MGEELLSLRNISKTYAGVRALDSFSISVRKGEVHCLVGENGSGKSTFIKIVAGVEQPDSGFEITINGKPFHKLHAKDSLHEGIQVIYQDLSLFPNLSVAENIAMNQFREEKRKIVKWANLNKIALDAMEKIGVELELSAMVEDLSIAKQQLVAICRAITRGERLIIMDEPTSSLGEKDIAHLFSVIRTLTNRGVSILFVGHKLNEILEIADRVTVIRDGKNVGTFPVEELDKEKLIELMTGKKIAPSTYMSTRERLELILETRNLTKKEQYEDINLKLHTGEIVGLTGLLGSGRTELALSIFGLNRPDSGDIYIRGKRSSIRSVQDAMALGIGYLPENRLSQGLFMNQTVGNNIIVTILKYMINRVSMLDQKRIDGINKTWIKELAIKTPSASLAVKQLSGGNQQRVVLAKWLACNLKVLILDGPTIGIDVGAKEEIHAIIKDLANKGLGILLISDEVSEVLHNSNRLLLMKEGRIINEADTSTATENSILDQLK